MNFFGFTVSLLAIGCAVAVPLSSGVDSNEINTDSEFVSGLNKCAYQSDASGIASCATERIVRSLNQLTSQQNIEVIPGVSLLSDGTPSFRSGKSLKEELEQAKSGSMLELIGNATARFFSGRTLKVKLPTTEEIGRALEEGRKRTGGNKGGKNGFKTGMMGMGAIFAGLVPLFMGKIALITAKALLIGKIALVLSVILLVQMFMGHKGGSSQAVESSWSAPAPVYGPPQSNYGPPSSSYGVPSAQYPYSRSFIASEAEEPKYSQQMAYAAQRK